MPEGDGSCCCGGRLAGCPRGRKEEAGQMPILTRCLPSDWENNVILLYCLEIALH